jgi:hypothetical protein
MSRFSFGGKKEKEKINHEFFSSFAPAKTSAIMVAVRARHEIHSYYFLPKGLLAVVRIAKTDET